MASFETVDVRFGARGGHAGALGGLLRPLCCELRVGGPLLRRAQRPLGLGDARRCVVELRRRPLDGGLAAGHDGLLPDDRRRLRGGLGRGALLRRARRGQFDLLDNGLRRT